MNSGTEWSVAFDVLFNNITSNQAPGLNEYEKSLFLTRAQGNLVKEVFSARANQLLEGFDGSPIRQSDFSSLIVTDSLTSGSAAKKIDQRDTTKVYQYPSGNILAVLNETVEEAITVGTGANASTTKKEYIVVPISYEEFIRLMAKPYKYPPKGIVWRLINTGASQTTVEIIGRFTSNSSVTYNMRYVKWPDPIITGSISPAIDGKNSAANTVLPKHLHDEILHRAVTLAKIAWEDTVPSSTTVR